MKKKKEKWEQIGQEYVVSLFPVFSLIDTIYFDFKKYFKKNGDLLAHIKDQAITYYTKPTSWKRIHNLIVKEFENNDNYFINLFNEIENLAKLQTKTLLLLKPKKLSNKQLFDAYYNFVILNQKIYSYGAQMPFMDYQSTTYFTEKTVSLLKKYNSEKFFSILTEPVFETYNKKQEVNLYKIYKKIIENKKAYELLGAESNDIFLKILKKKYKQIYSIIFKHFKSFQWVFYVYEGPAADLNFFVDSLIDLKNRKVKPQLYLNNLKKLEKINLNQQNDFEKNNKLTVEEINLLKITRLFIFFKPYRRELQSRTYFLAEPLLKEIAKRLQFSINQLRMMMPNEVKDALLKNKIKIEVLNKRLKNLVYFIKNNKRVCLSDKQAENYLKKHAKKQNKVNKKIKTILGTTSYQGKVKGKVKVINKPTDMFKMQEGDILLAVTTSPNLMPAIRKAKAIITDEGGMTCHAAIVSRELKIPCVIGTKIATQVLKDGDRVEVDANKGIVKKMVNKKGG